MSESRAKEPRLPREILRKLRSFARRSARQIIVIHWYDANFDSTGKIVDGEVRCNVGCPDSTIGYYHGIKDGCVVLSQSAYVGTGGHESHRNIFSIPTGMVIKVDALEYKRGA